MSTSYFDLASQTIPFNLKGFHGEVSIYYGVNEDPQKTGFDVLPDLPFDIGLSRGSPVIQARVERYHGTGYRMFCGWIQIITSIYRDSQANRTEFVSTDIAPAFEDTNTPFAAFGYLPQLFDAPTLNLGDAAELRWTADTFLTTAPMRTRDEEISWLLGFRWGYTENNEPGEKPALLPLQVTDKDIWNQHLPFLRRQYSRWQFKNA